MPHFRYFCRPLASPVSTHIQRSNARDVLILHGLEAIIEVSSNLGAFYVGSTTVKITKRYQLGSESPDTIIVYCTSDDLLRDEAFAIERISEILLGMGKKDLQNTRRPPIIDGGESAKQGFVYVKCCSAIAPTAISFVKSQALAVGSINGEKLKLAKQEEEFLREKKSAVEALSMQLAQCSLATSAAQQSFSDMFMAAGQTLDSSTLLARPLLNLIDYKTASLAKLELLLNDDAAILRRTLFEITNSTKNP